MYSLELAYRIQYPILNYILHGQFKNMGYNYWSNVCLYDCKTTELEKISVLWELTIIPCHQFLAVSTLATHCRCLCCLFSQLYLEYTLAEISTSIWEKANLINSESNEI